MSSSPPEPASFDAARIDAAVDALRPELIEFARSLVRIPSVSGSEQAAQRAIAAKYESLGLSVDIVPSVREELESHPAFCDDAIPFVDRLNVVARWRGTGGGRSLILNGHIDVVPPGDLSKWTRDPWGGEIEGDRLYGRGACDMKSGLAAAAFAVQALQASGVKLRGDVMLQSVIGEESGGVGTLATIVRGYRADACVILEPMNLRLAPVAPGAGARRATIVRGYRADACVILEPMNLRLAPVQTGALTFRITVNGRAAHACMRPHGVSAITEFLPIASALEHLNVDRHQRYR